MINSLPITSGWMASVIHGQGRITKGVITSKRHGQGRLYLTLRQVSICGRRKDNKVAWRSKPGVVVRLRIELNSCPWQAGTSTLVSKDLLGAIGCVVKMEGASANNDDSLTLADISQIVFANATDTESSA